MPFGLVEELSLSSFRTIPNNPRKKPEYQFSNLFCERSMDHSKCSEALAFRSISLSALPTPWLLRYATFRAMG
jgi:hypothetical protein